MFPVLRRTLMVAALVGSTAVTAEAQGLKVGPVKIEEIRIDLAQIVILTDAFTAVGAGAPNVSTGLAATVMPSSIAFGVYLNDRIALEPSVSFVNVSPDAGDATTLISLGVSVPYYFAGDRGKTGLFVAPNLSINTMTDEDTRTDFGIDVGVKKSLSNMVSWSAAAVFRTGDTYDPEAVMGARFGLSVFLR